MKSIEALTDSELDEIIDGCVDGVYPTWQEVSMAMELKTRRANLAVEEPDYMRYSCGCCGYESLSSISICTKCNFDKIEETPLFTHPAPSIHSIQVEPVIRIGPHVANPGSTGATDLLSPPQLPTAPSIPASPDYFAGLVAAARVRADKAMRRFPQPNYVLNKVAEESGEVIKAVIHYTEGREEWSNVEDEIIDNLAMLLRLVTEGDQVIGFTPPDPYHAALPANGNW